MDSTITLPFLGPISAFLLPAIALCGILLVPPIEIMLHELGHAVIARILTRRPVAVHLWYMPIHRKHAVPVSVHSTLSLPEPEPRHDVNQGKPVCSLAGITFYLNLRKFDAWTGIAIWERHSPPSLVIWSLLAGPTISFLLLLTGLLLLFIPTIPSPLRCLAIFIAFTALLHCLSTALPWQLSSGQQSDGYKIWHLIRKTSCS